jgi:tRNA-2-methylthio-N6-dimethylallyladenosine synthase
MEQTPKTFHIQTFGCQMNERDSETLAGMLEELGYTRTENKKTADVAIINTCSVRENADKRFFGTLGQLKKIKEARPDFVACICGCMMQQQHIIDTVKSKYPWVDVIFGTHNLHEFPRLLESVTQEHVRRTSVWEEPGDIVEGLPARREFPHKAFVNIMYGCDNYCTYCIVPYTRGRERSRRPEDVLREVRDLAEDGVREVTLLGQNVNSYRGVDEAGNDVDFAGLIRLLDRVPGIRRIRFMTSHPKDLSDRLIEAYRDCRSLCPAIHLPVQSGSDRVLAAMNRRYTAAAYEDLVRRLREAVPDLCITTDIIVGFPGETEEDFQDTLGLCRRVGFDAAFTFLYSPRKGTPAEGYGDQVPEDVKHRRFRELVEVINQSSAEKNRAYIGREVEVLVDGPSKTDPAMKSGRTPGFKLLDFSGDASAGDLVQVRVTEARTFSLKGEQSH